MLQQRCKRVGAYCRSCALLLTLLASSTMALQATVQPAAAAKPSAVQSVSLQLGRCAGSCPVYRVDVDASGEMRYFADLNATEPTARQQISEEDWQRILDAFNESHFDRLQPEYTSKAHGCRALRTDASTLHIELVTASSAQSLVFYTGCDLPERAAIMWLADTIATVSGARDWWRQHSQHGARKRVE